jgi:hypothetical protein
MSKFRNVFGAVLRGTVVLVHSVAAILIPTKFADAATRDDGAHKDRVASDEGLRFQLDARADEALARSEAYVQVAQKARSTNDVVEDAVQVLAERGVDVGALLQAGALDEAVQTLVESGEIQGADGGSEDFGLDLEEAVSDLTVAEIEEIVEGS